MRINLSEQTDMMDLLGLDLPVQGAKGGVFSWCDGVFLQALKVRIIILVSYFFNINNTNKINKITNNK